MLDWLCRRYQTLFRHSNPVEARLSDLHTSGQIDGFLVEYFDHEFEKGAAAIDRFTKLATGWRGGRALDFGCGAGGLTYQIARVCSEATGIDLEDYKLVYAREQADRLGQHNTRFVCYGGGALPFPDASFDCIFCVDVVEHLPDLERYVAEFRRVLAPGGQLLLSFGPPWYHPHGKHMWARLPGWWTHLLFPRVVVMRVGGFRPDTRWDELGLYRLSVAKFRRVMRRSGLTQLHCEERAQSIVRPLTYVPGVRELFIAEVVGVYQKPPA